MTSLESLQINYRELEILHPNKVKTLIGGSILAGLYILLLILHAVILPQMLELQFENWFSCTLFTFIFQVFGIDTLVYILAAWTLSRYGSKYKKLCSKFNLFVMWPLGKWKYMELEIELAKLKDFDKEYEVILYD